MSIGAPAGLGVELPPAVMMLRPFSPAHADSDNNELKPLKMVDADDVLLDSDGGAIEEQNLAYALSGGRFSETLFEPNAAFTGYAWYDALACLVVKHYCVIGDDDHSEIVLPGARSTSADRPDRLEIHCEIGSDSGVVDWQFETDRLILGEDHDYLDEVDILVTKFSKATSADLVDFMERALFCPSDDAEAGSWDQQRNWFHDEAEDMAIALLQTSAEADTNAVIRIVERELYWLRRKSGAVTIRIENGHVDVTGLQDEPTVAAE